MRSTLIMLILAIACQLNAQEEAKPDKGIFVGGGLSYSTGDYPLIFTSGAIFSNGNSTNANFSPYIGGKSGEHWVFGIGFNINYSKGEGYRTIGPGGMLQELETQNSSVAPFIFGRYSFNPAQKLQFFLAPRISYRFGNNEISFIETGETFSSEGFHGGSLGLGLGLQYRISEHLRLLGSLGGASYQFLNVEDEPDTSTQFSFNLNPSRMTLAAEWLF